MPLVFVSLTYWQVINPKVNIQTDFPLVNLWGLICVTLTFFIRNPIIHHLINRWPVDYPHKVPVTRKTFPFDAVILYWIFFWFNRKRICLFIKISSLALTIPMYAPFNVYIVLIDGLVIKMVAPNTLQIISGNFSLNDFAEVPHLELHWFKNRPKGVSPSCD